MMKVSRKVGRSSQKSTSISRRKKKKSNEKNNLGKSGKRSRGHKRVKTYKRVKIFHKGGAPPKIEYTANLEYKKKVWFLFLIIVKLVILKYLYLYLNHRDIQDVIRIRIHILSQ